MYPYNNTLNSKQGVGCQEETYDNMAMMFSGILIYTIFQVSDYHYWSTVTLSEPKSS